MADELYSLYTVRVGVAQFRRGAMALLCRKRWHAVIEMMGPTPPDTLSSEERLRTAAVHHGTKSLASLRQLAQNNASTPTSLQLSSRTGF